MGGLRVGVGVDELGGGASPAQDATSGKYVPASSAQWATLLAGTGIGSPTHVWLMQEASGDLADSVGVETLTAAGMSYQQAVTGWTRKAITVSEGGAGGPQSVTVGDLGASALLLGYMNIRSTPGATETMMGIGAGAAHKVARVTTGPVYNAADNGGGTPVSGAANPGTTVHPVAIRLDRAATTFCVITDQEVIVGPWVGLPGAGALLKFGAAIGTTAPAGYLYGALWEGVQAQMSDATVRTLLQKLAWTVAW